MVRGWLIFILANVLIFLFLIPAYDFRPDLHTLSKNRLTLLNIHGSIWYGSASLGISDGRRTYALPGEINWYPMLFLDGMIIGFSVSHPNLEDNIYFGLRPIGFGLGSGKASFPATWLTALGAPFNSIRPEGQIELNWGRIVSGEPFKAELIWTDAQSVLSQVRPLGDYKLEVSGVTKGPMNFKISTLKGKLQIDVSGETKPGEKPNIKGYASASDGVDSPIKGILGHIGRPKDGKYEITIFNEVGR